MALHHLPLDAPIKAARPAPSLWLARLVLSDFRNYAEAELSFDGRPVVLFGTNGAGKTNLLEALSLLAPGRGLRRARIADLARQGSGGAWAVAGEIETPLGRRQLGTGLEAGGGERRQARLDGESARGLAAFAEVFDLLWLTPQMDGLLREGSGERRRFLDRLVFGFDPAHAGRVMAYETALRERARLLADGRLDEPWLAGLEAQMAERAVAIAWARRLLVQRLCAACSLEEGPFPKAGMALSGTIDSWLDEGSALDLEERLKAAWRQSRPQDAASGQTEIGVHRGDLKVTHLAKGQPAALSSTGEQKALLLSIVLAHSRLTQLDRGRPPILLLDEVAAHLDEERRLCLFQTLLASGAQAFLTGTDPSVFAPLGRQAQFFAVADGSLRLLP